MKSIQLGLSDCSPIEILLTMSHMGGEVTREPGKISIMLNGLRYYSLEVVLVDKCYNIQAYEQEAVDLYEAAMTLPSHRNYIIK